MFLWLLVPDKDLACACEVVDSHLVDRHRGPMAFIAEQFQVAGRPARHSEL